MTEIYNTRSRETFMLSFQTWNTPNKIFELKWNGKDLDTSKVVTAQIQGTNPNDFVIEEYHAVSKDGTKIPYFITYHKGKQRDGKSPCWLHAYGGFGEIDNFNYKPN